MLRCFDCNASAADAVPLTQDSSWMGPSNPSKAAAQEPVTTQKRSALNTEYKLKFRPFSDYTYVDGRFSGAQDAADGGAAGRDAPATPWYEEVVELRKKASSYKVRGWGREMAQPHLAHLYDREEDPSLLAERKIISALYLETLKPGLVREERGRSPVATGGASVRQQSHPPPSTRKSPGATKMALKLHAAEGSKRPHSAQPSSERHAGDAVDRAKGRSPAASRTPTAKADAGAPAERPKARKRPTDSAGGTPDSGGKGIRGGTPRSRSAHRLAAKARSPTKAEKAPPPAPMASSAPAPETAPEPEPAPAPASIDAGEDAPPAAKPAEEMVRSAPEPTRVKSPEQMAPIKSPEPVNWTVPLDTGKTFTVTQNVMPGTGSPQSSRADSLRSPGDEVARSPLARGVTDVSHLRNGEPTDSPLVNDLPSAPPAANGQQSDFNHRDDVAGDPMSMSMVGDELQRSFHAADPMSGSMSGKELQRALQDPMTASMTGDDLQRSLHDSMTASMTGEDLQRSLHDPMTASMTGDDLQRSLHDSMTTSSAGGDLPRAPHDPMKTSMTGDELQRSLHAEPAAGDAAAAAPPD
ncbi:translation initiation factor IF-2-like [Pollicipes pollicipes]|uniref:translation initiation factor IF-2-like n=2 Tax=Pollicipes pollicipes TaxID=41117 RepID=UPI001884B37C|nr:translation initiation factor IF-2-like [Pollicipes pollicipes]